jgi:plasmid maintenance system antidote protein VapI
MAAYVPAALVGRHVAALKDGGWTEPEIAAAANVDRRTIHAIVTAERLSVHQRTAAAVLALAPSDAPNRVPAVGAMRRLQALAVMGWPLAHVGHLIGTYPTKVNDLVAGRRKRISRTQADAIDTIYRALHATPGPSRTTRTAAARNGWAPGEAWTDIDDPAVTPLEVAA